MILYLHSGLEELVQWGGGGGWRGEEGSEENGQRKKGSIPTWEGAKLLTQHLECP